MATYEEDTYGKKVKEIPDGAHFYGYRYGYIRVDEVYCQETKNRFYYHTHMVGGSNGKYSKHGCHEVYFLEKEKVNEKQETIDGVQ